MHALYTARFEKIYDPVEYQPGDRVWVRNLPHEADKLDPLWTGPCEVLERVGRTARYKVTLPEGVQDVHIDRMKMYLPRVDGTKIALHYYRPHRDVPEDDSWTVEKIVVHRIRGGRHQWRVRWQGFVETFDSWEPAKSFV